MKFKANYVNDLSILPVYTDIDLKGKKFLIVMEGLYNKLGEICNPNGTSLEYVLRNKLNFKKLVNVMAVLKYQLTKLTIILKR